MKIAIAIGILLTANAHGQWNGDSSYQPMIRETHRYYYPETPQYIHNSCHYIKPRYDDRIKLFGMTTPFRMNWLTPKSHVHIIETNCFQ
jgi:hypothetical protein